MSGRSRVVKRLKRMPPDGARANTNIVSLMTVLSWTETMLVMEYATGETRPDPEPDSTIAQAGGRRSSKPRDESLPLILTPDIAYEIVVQCLTALDYAHSKGVLHLDIKPGNIMLQRDRMARHGQTDGLWHRAYTGRLESASAVTARHSPRGRWHAGIHGAADRSRTLWYCRPTADLIARRHLLKC